MWQVRVLFSPESLLFTMDCFWFVHTATGLGSAAHVAPAAWEATDPQTIRMSRQCSQRSLDISSCYQSCRLHWGLSSLKSLWPWGSGVKPKDLHYWQVPGDFGGWGFIFGPHWLPSLEAPGRLEGQTFWPALYPHTVGFSREQQSHFKET